jgi:hypothetical protein
MIDRFSTYMPLIHQEDHHPNQTTQIGLNQNLSLLFLRLRLSFLLLRLLFFFFFFFGFGFADLRINFSL